VGAEGRINMEKYNFDQIFCSDDNLLKIKRQNAFFEGLKALAREVMKDYAHFVLHGEPAEVLFQRFSELEAAKDALIRDPRTVALKAWADVKYADQHKEAMRSMVSEALNQAFK
jgi:hypothetical protein